MAKKNKKDTETKIKKSAAPKEAPSLFDKTLSMLTEEYGDRIIKTLSQMKDESEYGISTGSLGLDWIMNKSAGGMVKGQIVELYGPFSTGKTTLALGLCANATANGLKVIYLDVERSLRYQAVANAGRRRRKPCGPTDLGTNERNRGTS